MSFFFFTAVVVILQNIQYERTWIMICIIGSVWCSSGKCRKQHIIIYTCNVKNNKKANAMPGIESNERKTQSIRTAQLYQWAKKKYPALLVDFHIIRQMCYICIFFVSILIFHTFTASQQCIEMLCSVCNTCIFTIGV